MSAEQKIVEVLVEDNAALQEEIAELKAMINNLQIASKLVVNTAGFKCSINGLESALSKTKQQCVADVRADVVSLVAEVIEDTALFSQNEHSVKTRAAICGAVRGLEQQLRDNAK